MTRLPFSILNPDDDMRLCSGNPEGVELLPREKCSIRTQNCQVKRIVTSAASHLRQSQPICTARAQATHGILHRLELVPKLDPTEHDMSHTVAHKCKLG